MADTKDTALNRALRVEIDSQRAIQQRLYSDTSALVETQRELRERLDVISAQIDLNRSEISALDTLITELQAEREAVQRV